MENVDDFIYGKNEQLKLHKQYQKFISPKKYTVKQNLSKEYFQHKDKLPERLNRKRQHDQVRDKLPERKAKKNEQDKLPERKAKKATYDKKRQQTSKRKEMDRNKKKRDYRRDQLNNFEASETKRIQRNIKNKQKYLKLLRLSLPTDTGFDLVCSCCLQYKSSGFCKPIKCLSKEKIRKFIIDFCPLLKNRTEGQFVCHPCLNDIKRNTIPKKSHINQFKFAKIIHFETEANM